MNFIIGKIDNFLNSITMYRLVLNGLFLLTFISIILGFTSVISYGGFTLLLSFLVFCIACYGSNYVLSKIYTAPINIESSSITALILFLIVEPSHTLIGIISIIFVSVFAMASKYVFALYKKHIFNPTAISVFIATFVFGGVAVWWVGTPWLTPFVLIFGLLVVRKIRRFSLFFSFVIPAIITSLSVALFNGFAFLDTLISLSISSPLLFLGTIMLTEPSTTPPTCRLQVIYGMIVGVLYGLQFNLSIGSIFIYSTPHLALIIGNIFSYIVSSKEKYFLTLKEINTIALDTYEFVFSLPKNQKHTFLAGQYAEWTLPTLQSDNRGNRRFFTFVSSPTESVVRLATKITQTSSSFKKQLRTLVVNSIIVASSVAGDFTLPKDSSQKIVWIAGGIGITPFVSKTQYLIDTQGKRDVVLFYSASTQDSFAYTNLFKQGSDAFGLKTVYVLGGSQNIPKDWTGKTGYITGEMIMSETPDYVSRIFYISGPNAMVDSYKKVLQSIGIDSSHIITDYFPGF